MLQGKGSSFFDYGLSFNKSFLDKRLTLSAFASNFFKKDMDQSSTTEGKITMKTLDAACRRILEAKYKLGLFDDP